MKGLESTPPPRHLNPISTYIYTYISTIFEPLTYTYDFRRAMTVRFSLHYISFPGSIGQGITSVAGGLD